MRTLTGLFAAILPCLALAQGFPSTSTTWALPSGGEVNNGVVQGFNLLSDVGTDPGSDTWSTVDINGDGKPDLVCTGTRAANGYVTEFSPGSNSYWKVYLNTSSGFSSSSTTWALPSGGEVNNGVVQGFNLLSDVGTDPGSDTWSTMDINGDGKPDLVCTGTRAANGYVTEFSPGSNSYWKVYLNTGSGFSSTSTTWALPSGGEVNNGVVQGFNLLSDVGTDPGSDAWSTVDINGDGKPDLVCTGTRAANGYVTEFSPGSNSYWKVYLNTGGGFSSTSTTWALPSGGEVNNGVVQGFNLLSDVGTDTGSDTWSTVDINGDGKPDLVCTGTRAANGYVTEFSPGSNSYWKVYLNTGSGFSSTSTTWALPSGGEVNNGVVQGFNLLSDVGTDPGSDTWSTVDINGDGKPDLVCTGTRAANGYVTEFSPGSNSYWKVYLNTGSGFSSSSTTWALPSGGEVNNGVVQGFNLLSDVGTDPGSDTWSTVDINGDGKPDLVCTGTRAANGYVTEFSPGSNSYWKVYAPSGSTAVQEEAADGLQLELFPNPASDHVQLRTGMRMDLLDLFDATGSLVAHQRPLAFTAELHVGALPAGVYLLRLSTMEGTVTRRLVVAPYR